MLVAIDFDSTLARADPYVRLAAQTGTSDEVTALLDHVAADVDRRDLPILQAAGTGIAVDPTPLVEGESDRMPVGPFSAAMSLCGTDLIDLFDETIQPFALFLGVKMAVGVLGRAHVRVPAEILGLPAIAREHFAYHSPPCSMGLEVGSALVHVNLGCGRQRLQSRPRSLSRERRR